MALRWASLFPSVLKQPQSTNPPSLQTLPSTASAAATGLHPQTLLPSNSHSQIHDDPSSATQNSSSATTESCLFTNCGRAFPTLADLIYHVELDHVRKDGEVLKFSDINPIKTMHLTYLRAFNNESVLVKGTPPTNRAALLAGSSSSMSAAQTYPSHQLHETVRKRARPSMSDEPRQRVDKMMTPIEEARAASRVKDSDSERDKKLEAKRLKERERRKQFEEKKKAAAAPVRHKSDASIPISPSLSNWEQHSPYQPSESSVADSEYRRHDDDHDNNSYAMSHANSQPLTLPPLPLAEPYIAPPSTKSASAQLKKQLRQQAKAAAAAQPTPRLPPLVPVQAPLQPIMYEPLVPGQPYGVPLPSGFGSDPTLYADPILPHIASTHVVHHELVECPMPDCGLAFATADEFQQHFQTHLMESPPIQAAPTSSTTNNLLHQAFDFNILPTYDAHTQHLQHHPVASTGADLNDVLPLHISQILDGPLDMAAAVDAIDKELQLL